MPLAYRYWKAMPVALFIQRMRDTVARDPAIKKTPAYKKLVKDRGKEIRSYLKEVNVHLTNIDDALSPNDRLGAVTSMRIRSGSLVIPPQEVVAMKDLMARTRNHLSMGHTAVCATLLHQAENMIDKYTAKYRKEE